MKGFPLWALGVTECFCHHPANVPTVNLCSEAGHGHGGRIPRASDAEANGTVEGFESQPASRSALAASRALHNRSTAAPPGGPAAERPGDAAEHEPKA
jgi:hypothetical protein